MLLEVERKQNIPMCFGHDDAITELYRWPPYGI